MVIQEKLVTAEEFAAMRDDGTLHDLVRGVVIEVSRPKPLHSILQARLARFIDAFVDERKLGIVTTEGGYVLARNPDTVRGPDVAFLSKKRLPDPDLNEYIPIGPDLAVEIVSPGDTATEVLDKVALYFGAGTHIVWVIYPDKRQVYVYTSPKAVQILTQEDVLDGGEILPGFKLAVSEALRGAEG
jgi:Uma2 family endonuclease